MVTQTSGIFDTMMFGLVKVTLDTACDMMPPSIDGEYDDEPGCRTDGDDGNGSAELAPPVHCPLMTRAPPQHNIELGV